MSMKPRSPKPSKPGQDSQQDKPLSLQEKTDFAKMQQSRYSQIAATPGLSLPAALAARNLARSYGAAAVLGEKAQAYNQELDDPAAQADLMRTLGISPSRPGPQSNSAPENPPS